jgi:DNA-directed RNA polymerase subunit H (RpoH/RPB5)
MERSIMQRVLGVMLKDVHLGGLASVSKAFTTQRKIEIVEPSPLISKSSEEEDFQQEEELPKGLNIRSEAVHEVAENTTSSSSSILELSLPQKLRLLRSYRVLNEMLQDRGYMTSLNNFKGIGWGGDSSPMKINHMANSLVSHMLHCTVLLTTRLDPEKARTFETLQSSSGEFLTPPPLVVVFMCRDEKLGIRSIGACVSAMHKLNAAFEQLKTKKGGSIAARTAFGLTSSPLGCTAGDSNEPAVRHAIILVDGVITAPARRKLLDLQWKGRVVAPVKNEEEIPSASEEVTTTEKKKKDVKSTTAKAVLQDAFQAGFSMEAFTVDELQRNISRHQLVPKHTPLYGEKRKAILNRFKGPHSNSNLQENTLEAIVKRQDHFPKIWCSDPQVRYLGVPVGTLIEIQRNYVNQQIVPYYRVVVPEDMR